MNGLCRGDIIDALQTPGKIKASCLIEQLHNYSTASAQIVRSKIVILLIRIFAIFC